MKVLARIGILAIVIAVGYGIFYYEARISRNNEIALAASEHNHAQFDSLVRYIKQVDCQNVYVDSMRQVLDMHHKLRHKDSTLVLEDGWSVADSTIQDTTETEALQLKSATLEVHLTSGADDQELYKGNWIDHSNDLEMGYHTNGVYQEVKLAFSGISFPQNAEIQEAYVMFCAKSSNSGELKLSVNQVEWKPESWTAGEWYRTPDIKASVVPGSYLVHILPGVEKTYRNAWAWDQDDKTLAPKLIIKYNYYE
ncbi:hypothetical protein PP178_04295 [Zeaxanthinibacter sp. PT1]|uniref:hypothetical protein n=1 Tax=Zeaxanthinibacter TaxID=561554 RepID=UPI00234B70B3|nr:hypothetical protein [Zeaxanthinibacter sp. PT1]MDC6350760.1 hypothetical protein [Zeaxanthinibacter sp. PT1]